MRWEGFSTWSSIFTFWSFLYQQCGPSSFDRGRSLAYLPSFWRALWTCIMGKELHLRLFKLLFACWSWCFRACICSILAFVYRVPVSAESDGTWNAIMFWICSWVSLFFLQGQEHLTIVVVRILEMTAGLMIPCMPSIATLYRKYRHPILLHLSRCRLKFRTLITAIGSAYRHKLTESTDELNLSYEINSETVKRSPSVSTARGVKPERLYMHNEPLGNLEPMTAQILKTTKIEVSRGA